MPVRRTRTPVLLAALALLLGAITPAPAAAVTPSVKLALSGAPNPVMDGQQVTWTGTVTPMNGTVATVRLHMEGLWYQFSAGTSFVVAVGECAPAASCHTDSRTGNAYWTLTNLTKAVKITYTTAARTNQVITLWDDGGAPCYGSTCPAKAKVVPPSTAVVVRWTADAYPVMPGTTLHVAITGSVNAGMVDVDLQGLLGAGLADPTAIVPDGLVYWPPGRYIDDGVTLAVGSPQTLTFDTVVTASVGGTVTLTGNVYPGAWANAASATVAIHVGPYTTVYQETNTRLGYAGSWARLAGTGASGGYIKETAAKGAAVSMRFKGIKLTWLATVGPGRGTAQVYIDGVPVKTVSLYRASSKARVAVYAFTQATPAIHTIRIVCLGTAGHPRVNVDALAVGN